MKVKYFHDKNFSEVAPLRQERSPRRGDRRAGAINSLRSVKRNIFYIWMKVKYFHDKNVSEGAPLRQERSPRRGARRAGAINSLRSVKKFQFV